ncbi:MAG: hypothetical protein WED12_07140 [Chloroflexota bacterium]
MRPVTLSRAGFALLAASLVVGGVIVGSAASAWGDPRPATSPSGIATPSPPTPTAPDVPRVDVAGEEVAGLPRYPGSVRSGYEVITDDRYRLIAAEYLAAATVDEVRAFYQGVIAEHGWERADIGFSNGEWTYVLVDGSTEALIEIEELGGLVEIDLQLSEPLPAPPTPAPARTEAPQPPPPPPPGDDDDDDGGDPDDDDATDG